MKTLLLILYSIILIGFGFTSLEEPYVGENPILNQELKKVINTNDIKDPLREGSYMIISNQENKQLSGVINIGVIEDHTQAQNSVLNIIKSIINYALALTGLVALIYLIYHGMLILTAAGDDEQYKKGLKGLKYAGIAIAGIGLSWFFISFVFRLIEKIT